MFTAAACMTLASMFAQAADKGFTVREIGRSYAVAKADKVLIYEVSYGPLTWLPRRPGDQTVALGWRVCRAHGEA